MKNYYGVSQSVHGHEYRWIYDEDTLCCTCNVDAIYEFYTAGDRTVLINIKKKILKK